MKFQNLSIVCILGVAFSLPVLPQSFSTPKSIGQNSYIFQGSFGSNFGDVWSEFTLKKLKGSSLPNLDGRISDFELILSTGKILKAKCFVHYSCMEGTQTRIDEKGVSHQVDGGADIYRWSAIVELPLPILGYKIYRDGDSLLIDEKHFDKPIISWPNKQK